MSRLITIVGLLGLLTAAGLIYSGDHALSSARRSTSEAEAGCEPGGHWGYTGFEGPLYWGTNCMPGGPDSQHKYQSYNLCLNGETQSPISATALSKTGVISWSFHPGTVNGKAMDNGHAFALGSLDPGGQVLTGNSELSFGGTTYNLVQLHFHSPSEHRRWVNGTYAGFDPVEMHLVHRSASGALAVVGVFIDSSGNTNNELLHVKENLGNGNPIDFNVLNVLPADRSVWTYDGSLTTPPCTEGVKWFVMKNPIKVAPAQIDWLRSVYSNNSRGASFEQVKDQQLHQVSSGGAGVWGVSGDSDKRLYERTGISDENIRGTGWRGWLYHNVWASSGKKDAWVVAEGHVYYTNETGNYYEVRPTQPNLVRISAGSAGVWALDATNRVFYRTGITDSVPAGTGWQELANNSLKIKDIASGEFGVWGVDTSNVLYFLFSTKASMQPTIASWFQVDTNISRVSSGLLGVWALEAGSGTSQVIKSRSGITSGIPMGTGWRVQDGRLNEISSGMYGVWGRNQLQNVYFLSSPPSNSP